MRGNLWSDEEIGFLLDHPEMSSREIGKELGRGPQAALYIRRKVANGWSPTRAHRTESELDFIRENSHLRTSQLAGLLNISEWEVTHARKKLKDEGVRFGYPQVGRRVLIARTCHSCGLLRDAGWFRRTNSAWKSTCNLCRTDRDGPRPRPSRYNYSTPSQIKSLETATRNGEEWTGLDYKILEDDSLTVLDKAIILNRTFYATRTRCRLTGAKSKPARLPGWRDPSEGIWKIELDPRVIALLNLPNGVE